MSLLHVMHITNYYPTDCNILAHNQPSMRILQNAAFLFLLSTFAFTSSLALWSQFWIKNRPNGLIKDIPKSPLGQCWAFQVLYGPYFSSHGHSLVIGNGRQFALSQAAKRLCVLSQILFQSYQQEGRLWTMMNQFGHPLHYMISIIKTTPILCALTLFLTFSNEIWSTREKQIRKTSVCG